MKCTRAVILWSLGSDINNIQYKFRPIHKCHHQTYLEILFWACADWIGEFLDRMWKYLEDVVYIPLDLRRYPRYGHHSNHPIIRFPRALCVNWGSLSSTRDYICPRNANPGSVERFRSYFGHQRSAGAFKSQKRRRWRERERVSELNISFPGWRFIPKEDGLLPWATSLAASARRA